MDLIEQFFSSSFRRFLALNVVVALLSMQGQKALRFHQKYFNFCSKDQRRFFQPTTKSHTPEWQSIFFKDDSFLDIFLKTLY